MKKITFCLPLFFLALSPSHTSQSEAEEMEELTRTELNSSSKAEEMEELTQMKLDSSSETEEGDKVELNAQKEVKSVKSKFIYFVSFCLVTSVISLPYFFFVKKNPLGQPNTVGSSWVFVTTIVLSFTLVNWVITNTIYWSINKVDGLISKIWTGRQSLLSN